MQKKWRKTGAALLIAGLTVTGTGYALADEKPGEVIDLSQLGKDTSTDAVEESPVTVESIEVDENDVTNGTEADKDADANKETGSDVDADKDADKDADQVGEDTEANENDLPEIPEGYTAGNLAALAKAYENVQNPTAKAAIKRNMERSIAKWESRQPVVEAPEKEVVEKSPVTEEQVKVEEVKTGDPVKKDVIKEEAVKNETSVKEEAPVKAKAKNPQAELNAKHKEQRKELKATQKAEREAFKEEKKAIKEQKKKEQKEKKH